MTTGTGTIPNSKNMEVQPPADDNIISIEYIKRADGKTVKRIKRKKVVKKVVKKSKDGVSEGKDTATIEFAPKSEESKAKPTDVPGANSVAPQNSKIKDTSYTQWASLLTQSYQLDNMPESTLGKVPEIKQQLPRTQGNEKCDDVHETYGIPGVKDEIGALTEISLSKTDDVNDDDEETNMNSSKSSSDGTLHVAGTEESKLSSGTCKLIIISVLFLALCSGAFWNFGFFNNPDKKSKPALSNGVGSLSVISGAPSSSPSISPTAVPTISGAPTLSSPPSDLPSITSSANPTISYAPSIEPTNEPSGNPSAGPTNKPTSKPSSSPSSSPTITSAPSSEPTTRPSNRPTISDSPSSSPSAEPSDRPTMTPSANPTTSYRPTTTPSTNPTKTPTVSPSKEPSRSPTRRPTPRPTPSPTAAPTIALDQRLRNYLENDFGVRVQSNQANEAISVIVEEAKANGFNDMELSPKIVQRFAMIVMELSLFDGSGKDWGSFKQDECAWPGTSCNGNQEVIDIRLLGKGLFGTIPSEIGLLKALNRLDLARNGIQGTIPEEMYQCLSLEKIFLYDNRLSGTISDKIIDLWDLKEFNLSTNQISGTIPTTMRSTGRGIYKIRYFNVYDNQMTGPMPAQGSRLRQLYYLDLGRNQFSGRVPVMDEYVRLRHLYLDHNNFSGDLPSNIVNVGNGRLKILAVNDNRFTGRLPGEHTVVNELMQYTAQNNQFSSMYGRTCQLNVIHTPEWGGQSSEFKSDCNICACGRDDLFCKYCY